MVRRLAVRKILTATGVLRSTYIVATVSLILSVLGILLYLYEPSDVIL
ncbi:MAG TPA: cobalt transporter, partial [Pyrodictium delaneyi]|nr:cobalt transporter [Pyrodictium delaneyi]